MGAALRPILTTQFVEFGSQHTNFKVEQGSGTGMRHAGEVADWLIWLAVEEPMVADLAGLGVICYLRYRDDLFACLEDLSTSPIFRTKIEGLAAKYCTVGLESYSLVGVPFLDLLIYT